MNSTRLSLALIDLPLTPFGMKSPLSNKKKKLRRNGEMCIKPSLMQLKSLKTSRLSPLQEKENINLSVNLSNVNTRRRKVHGENRRLRRNLYSPEMEPLTDNLTRNTNNIKAKRESLYTDIDDGSFVEFTGKSSPEKEGLPLPQFFYTCTDNNETKYSTSSKIPLSPVGFRKYVDNLKKYSNSENLQPLEAAINVYDFDETIISGSRDIMKGKPCEKLNAIFNSTAFNEHPKLSRNIPNISTLTNEYVFHCPDSNDKKKVNTVECIVIEESEDESIDQSTLFRKHSEKNAKSYKANPPIVENNYIQKVLDSSLISEDISLSPSVPEIFNRIASPLKASSEDTAEQAYAFNELKSGNSREGILANKNNENITSHREIASPRVKIDKHKVVKENHKETENQRADLDDHSIEVDDRVVRWVLSSPFKDSSFGTSFVVSENISPGLPKNDVEPVGGGMSSQSLELRLSDDVSLGRDSGKTVFTLGRVAESPAIENVIPVCKRNSLLSDKESNEEYGVPLYKLYSPSTTSSENNYKLGPIEKEGQVLNLNNADQSSPVLKGEVRSALQNCQIKEHNPLMPKFLSGKCFKNTDYFLITDDSISDTEDKNTSYSKEKNYLNESGIRPLDNEECPSRLDHLLRSFYHKPKFKARFNLSRSRSDSELNLSKKSNEENSLTNKKIITGNEPTLPVDNIYGSNAFEDLAAKNNCIKPIIPIDSADESILAADFKDRPLNPSSSKHTPPKYSSNPVADNDQEPFTNMRRTAEFQCIDSSYESLPDVDLHNYKSVALLQSPKCIIASDSENDRVTLSSKRHPSDLRQTLINNQNSFQQKKETESKINYKPPVLCVAISDSSEDEYENLNSLKKVANKDFRNCINGVVSDSADQEYYISSPEVNENCQTNKKKNKKNIHRKKTPRVIISSSSDSEDEDFGYLNTKKNVKTKHTKQKPTEKVDIKRKDCEQLTFLSSLGLDVPLSKAHIDAIPFIKNFRKMRDVLVSKLYALYNTKIFNDQLPLSMNIKWNSRLTATAGFCYYQIDKSKSSGRGARIELSPKVIDAPGRLRDTLIHEMCHAASWIISGNKGGHGRIWKSWASKASEMFPELPLIERCHSYKVQCKYTYKCVNCGYSIGRHSKSLDTKKKVCGYCYGEFELLINYSESGSKSEAKTPKLGTANTASTPRTPGPFALYVKDNYGLIKKSQSDMKHRDIMRALSEQFAKMKTKT